MIIRKLFKFESSHIVRNCSTLRCKKSIHGHSYKCEVFLESDVLDNGQMVYDFGLMKKDIKQVVDSFDHSIVVWDKDTKEYIDSMISLSSRHILLPVSPSCEQLSRVLFVLIDKIISKAIYMNGEDSIKLYSVIVHETDTGYAQCFKDDAYSKKMGLIDIKKIIFSDAIKDEWYKKEEFEKIIFK